MSLVVCLFIIALRSHCFCLFNIIVFLISVYLHFLFLNLWFPYWFILRNGKFCWLIKRMVVRAMGKMRWQRTIHQHQSLQLHLMRILNIWHNLHRKILPAQQILLQLHLLQLGNSFYLTRYAINDPESLQILNRNTSVIKLLVYLAQFNNISFSYIIH